jgi:hypothetical protein
MKSGKQENEPAALRKSRVRAAVGAEDILPNGTYQHVDGLGDGPLT